MINLFKFIGTVFCATSIVIKAVIGFTGLKVDNSTKPMIYGLCSVIAHAFIIAVLWAL